MRATVAMLSFPTMAGMCEMPLFPLGQVLFIGACMPLRVFEPRYVDMVGRCLREDAAFGVVLIRKGADAYIGTDARQPDIFNIGTSARIVDFDQASDGMLTIKVLGESKFRIHGTEEQADHLLVGEVEMLPEELEVPLGEDFEWLATLLQELMRHPLMADRWRDELDLRDARAVGWRLSDMLPLPPETKQGLLQMNLPRERLTEIRRLVNKLRG